MERPDFALFLSLEMGEMESKKGAAPLLDIGTELHRLAKVVDRCSGYWSVKAWPSCGEASVTFVSDVEHRFLTQSSREAREAGNRQREAAGFKAVESSEERAVRRAKGAVRRYSRHNGCDAMATFTFAGDVPGYESLSDVIDFFWRRWSRRSGVKPGPYVWVPEWGKLTGRLHVHMAVPWWWRLQAVEVCERCALDSLRAVRSDIPSASSFCIGCIWGHGFVGAPKRNSDGMALSQYLSKYMSKDLGSELSRGQQRYRVAQGYLPSDVKEQSESADEGVSRAIALVCGTLPQHLQTPIMYVM
jgi:hypothetical protein